MTHGKRRELTQNRPDDFVVPQSVFLRLVATALSPVITVPRVLETDGPAPTNVRSGACS